MRGRKYSKSLCSDTEITLSVSQLPKETSLFGIDLWTNNNLSDATLFLIERGYDDLTTLHAKLHSVVSRLEIDEKFNSDGLRFTKLFPTILNSVTK